MTLLELFLKKKINFRKGYIQSISSDGPVKNIFDISPKEFLSFSKHDFKTDDKRGRVNALSNAKRAIDCQVEKVFTHLGLNPTKLPAAVIILIKDFLATTVIKKDIKSHLLFLQAIGFAPASIISNVRNLRHDLEHFYKEPSKVQVSEAIDLAELFISATDSKLHNIWNYDITDEEEKNHEGIHVKYDSKEHLFVITARPIDHTDLLATNPEKTVIIKNDQVEFYHLMKIATSLDYEIDTQEAVIGLLQKIDHKIPEQHIRIVTEMH